MSWFESVLEMLWLWLVSVLVLPGSLYASSLEESGSKNNHAEIASQVVQQLQALGHHRGLGIPTPARSAPLHQPLVETAGYYDPYISPEYYKLEPAEPTPSSDLTPSGININGALGFISYLVLLTLLQSAVEGVASRAPSRRRRAIDHLPPLLARGRIGRASVTNLQDSEKQLF